MAIIKLFSTVHRSYGKRLQSPHNGLIWKRHGPILNEPNICTHNWQWIICWSDSVYKRHYQRKRVQSFFRFVTITNKLVDTLSACIYFSLSRFEVGFFLDFLHLSPVANRKTVPVQPEWFVYWKVFTFSSFGLLFLLWYQNGESFIYDFINSPLNSLPIDKIVNEIK